jgi:hypothetical protein
MKAIIFSIIFTFFCLSTLAQARLTIENNSQRMMTVKVMKGYSGKGTLHETVTISAFSSRTVYFSTSGHYFTKTKAVLGGKEPVYQKGQPFQVTNDQTGYSVMTLAFTIKESTIPEVLGGQQISRAEFEEN